jgi:hypothetical protein
MINFLESHASERKHGLNIIPHPKVVGKEKLEYIQMLLFVGMEQEAEEAEGEKFVILQNPSGHLCLFDGGETLRRAEHADHAQETGT